MRVGAQGAEFRTPDAIRLRTVVHFELDLVTFQICRPHGPRAFDPEQIGFKVVS